MQTVDQALIKTNMLQPATWTDLEGYVRKPEFKALLDRLLTIKSKQDLRTFAVLSPQEKDGRTFLTMALAIAFAQFLNQRVLIVDASHREPKIIDGEPKNSFELLAVDAFEITDRESAGFLVASTARDKIHLLNFYDLRNKYGEGVEYFADQIFKKLQNDYDIVLVDTAALLANQQVSFDSFIVAKRCDASALLISGRHELRMPILERLFTEVQATRINLVGVIVDEGNARWTPRA